MQATKKALAQYRRDMAALKRDVSALQRQVAFAPTRSPRYPPTRRDLPTAPKVRFVPNGLRSQRSRLGLSAEDYGKLVGVSAQSIYNWKRGHAAARVEGTWRDYGTARHQQENRKSPPGANERKKRQGFPKALTVLSILPLFVKSSYL